MRYDLSVLKALVRLSRTRTAATEDQLLLRAGGEPRDLAGALRRLGRAGLVCLRRDGRAQLTLMGFALGLATPASATRHQGAARAVAPVRRLHERRGVRRAA